MCLSNVIISDEQTGMETNRTHTQKHRDLVHLFSTAIQKEWKFLYTDARLHHHLKTQLCWLYILVSRSKSHYEGADLVLTRPLIAASVGLRATKTDLKTHPYY